MMIGETRYHRMLLLIAALGIAAPAVACRGKDAPPGGGDAATTGGDTPTEVLGLKTAAAFAGIKDPVERAKALFGEAGRVLMHPRCTNCHPVGESPLQGDDMRLHEPPVVRGEGGMGVVGMQCQTCHMPTNVDLIDRGVPGHPAWHLAPASMGWVGQSLTAICEQLKDPARNGVRDLAAIVAHSSEDSLVGWGWDPGIGRAAPPGDQKTFGGLIAAWVDAGAHCP